MKKVLSIRYTDTEGSVKEFEIDVRDTELFVQAMETAAIVGNLDTLYVIPCGKTEPIKVDPTEPFWTKEFK